jgi:hypothetical protein
VTPSGLVGLPKPDAPLSPGFFLWVPFFRTQGRGVKRTGNPYEGVWEMGSAGTIASVFLRAYRSLRRASDVSFGATESTTWPRVILSQKLAQLEAAHELLPPPLRQRAWILTSVERGM